MSDTITKEDANEGCQECNGIGIDDTDCDECGGSGEIDVTYHTTVTYHHADGTEDEFEEEPREAVESCVRCDGSTDDAECGHCEGSGVAA